MKILQLSSARTFGGGERHLVDLSHALVARGHEVYAALSTNSPLAARLTHVPPANIIKLPLRNALDVASATQLARFIREHEIEIVHAHLARDYPPAAYAVRRAQNVQFVLTRHVPFALSSLHKFTLTNVASVIAVSEGVARGLRGQQIFPDEKIRVVPNGLDVARLDAALGTLDRKKVRREFALDAPLLVGTVGELSTVKGQEELVQAAALIIKGEGLGDNREGVSVKHEGFDRAQFLIIGDDLSSDGATRTRLVQLIAEHGLEAHVKLIPYVAELTPLVAALDVYVSPSRAEAFGLATLEALMCGIATVATETDGSRELIEDGVTGRLVPIDDGEALARVIFAMLQDKKERAAMGKRARESARARFTLERMVEATESIYMEALAKGTQT